HIDKAISGGVVGAQQVGQQGLHPASGEQRRRVVAQHQRRPIDDGVSVADEVVYVQLPDLVDVHCDNSWNRRSIEPPRAEIQIELLDALSLFVFANLGRLRRNTSDVLTN